MARGSDYPLGAAMSTVKAGLSARSGLRAFRQGGGRTTDSTWFRMVAQVRAELSDQLDEASRPLSRRPVAGEITVIESVTRSGYWQQMTVFARDRQTGEVYTSDFVVRGSGLLTRQAAIDFATAEWEAGSSGSPNPQDDTLLGVAYVSTLELRPRS